MKNKFGRALLSLVIAFGIWLYVITVVNPESVQKYYNVPVVLAGSNMLESRGLMLISTSDVQLDLELTGNRTDLNQLSKDNITILADLSGITSAGQHTVRYDISYPGSISSGIKPVNQESQYLTVEVAEWAKKDVPVVVHYQGALPEDYTADRQNVMLDHDKVTISGPKNVIDRIQTAAITLELDGRKEDFTQSRDITFVDQNELPVTDLNHVTVSATQVTASLKVSMIKTVDIVVEVIPGGGMVQEDISFVADRNQLVVSGPAATLEDLDAITLTIDLSKLSATQTLKFDIVLPEGVTNVSGVPQVSVDVTVPEITTKTMAIFNSQFKVINLPENMVVSFITEQIAIVFQGRANRLAELKNENIRIIVDLSDAVEGKSVYSVVIEVEGVDGVGVISEHTVMADVTVYATQNPEEAWNRSDWYKVLDPMD